MKRKIIFRDKNKMFKELEQRKKRTKQIDN